MSAPDTASIIDLYDSLLAAEDERARARIIANAFERLEDRYPEIKDMVTASGLRETELRLQKEIEQTRLRIEEVRSELGKDIEQVRADLSKEIEQVRLRIEEVRSELGKDIEQVRLRIEEVRADLTKEIEQVRSDLTKEIALGNQKVLRWTTALMFAQLAAIFAALAGVYLM
ncbi:MAG: hypothetical protein U5L00_18120 [Desulfovermiculus sp.]|nr:hypothetical protein [Desulfovermiculus sp.]